MHKIQEKEFTLENFSCEHLLGGLNHYDERKVPYLDFSPLRDDSCTYSPAGILECCIIPMLNLCREKYLECDKALKSNSKYGIYPEKSINNIKELQKQYWWQMIQLLPSSYNQTRNVMLNYEVLAYIYKSRKNHKLDEWREFCKFIEELPYSELITTGIPYMKRAVNIEDETDEILTPNEQREKLGLEPIEDPINFEAIVDKLNSIGCPNPITSEEINAAIDKKDLVEVTRCKNCQFYISKENMKKDDMYANYMDDLNNADGFCVNGDVFTNEDDFCSCAEM